MDIKSLIAKLNMAKMAFKANSKYTEAIWEFEAQQPTSMEQTFNKFCQFIIKEYTKCNKQSCTTAKSVSFGIANYVQTATNNDNEAAEEAAWAVAKLVHNIQDANNKQIEAFIKPNTDMLKQIVVAVGKERGNAPNNSNHWHQWGHQCPHCKYCHPKTPDDKCWNWRQMQCNIPQTGSLSKTGPHAVPEGMKSTKSQSGSSQEKNR